MSTQTIRPKQGDRLRVEIDAGQRGRVDHVGYRIDGVGAGILSAGTVQSVPHYVSVDTCKENGSYLYALDVRAEATYDDGEKWVTHTLRDGVSEPVSDLTVCRNSREDFDRTYAVYVAKNSDQEMEDLDVEIASEFIDEFGTYSLSQYYWAEPRFFKDQSISFSDSVDMAISIGHGTHHSYYAGESANERVNLANTAYGGCSTCYQTGDLEYLAFAACRVLSMDDYHGMSFWYYWFHRQSTRLEKRPFTGLHMVLGFRTGFNVAVSWADNDGTDFADTLAEYLDDNMKVIDAWQEAVGDELHFDDGSNRGAVLYHKRYENDRLSNNKSDYIYGNSEYDPWIDYWE